jgi:hypothetical protein
MQGKTVSQQTRNRNLVIPAGASKSTFLCGLCHLRDLRIIFLEVERLFVS